MLIILLYFLHRFAFDLVDAFKDLAERIPLYMSQKSKSDLEKQCSPTFSSIRRVRNAVHLRANLKMLLLNLGENGEKFITFRMGGTDIVFAMVTILFLTTINVIYRTLEVCMWTAVLAIWKRNLS